MDVEREKAAILRLYETTRRGHLDGDAAQLLAQYAPRWDDLRAGTVVARTLDDELRRIADQLAGTRYLAWDDVTPPRVGRSCCSTCSRAPSKSRQRQVSPARSPLSIPVVAARRHSANSRSSRT